MRFPDYFPEGCPPSEAISKEVEVFRMCKSNVIEHSDFLSFYELGKNINGNVNGYGISVICDSGQAHTLSQMPAHRQEYLAKGSTKSDCGVILETPSRNISSHITWWLYEGATPEKYFK